MTDLRKLDWSQFWRSLKRLKEAWRLKDLKAWRPEDLKTWRRLKKAWPKPDSRKEAWTSAWRFKGLKAWRLRLEGLKCGLKSEVWCWHECGWQQAQTVSAKFSQMTVVWRQKPDDEVRWQSSWDDGWKTQSQVADDKVRWQQSEKKSQMQVTRSGDKKSQW